VQHSVTNELSFLLLGMMHIIRHVVERLEEATSHLAASNKDFQLKHLFEKYSLGKQVSPGRMEPNRRQYQLI
jgi:hypothetical protein